MYTQLFSTQNGKIDLSQGFLNFKYTIHFVAMPNMMEYVSLSGPRNNKSRKLEDDGGWVQRKDKNAFDWAQKLVLLWVQQPCS